MYIHHLLKCLALFVGTSFLLVGGLTATANGQTPPPTQRADQKKLLEALRAMSEDDAESKSLVEMLANQQKMEAEMNRPGLTPAQKSAIQRRYLTKMMEAQRAGAEARGDTAAVDQYRKFAEMAKADTKSASQNWTGMTQNGEAAAIARQAVKLAEMGSFDQAERGFAEACPAMRNKSIVDISPPIDLPALDASSRPMRSTNCYLEYALLRAKRTLGSGSTIDSIAFNAGQQASQTTSAMALASAGARRYARQRNMEGILDQIGVQLRSAEAKGKAFFERWPPEQLNERLGKDPKAMSTFTDDLLKLQRASQPHSDAINRHVQVLREKIPDYFDLRSPESLTIEELQSRVGPASRLLNPNEALILWVSSEGKRNGLVFAVTKQGAAWASMTLSGDEIASRIAKLRKQIDPCAFGLTGGTCSDIADRFDRQSSYELYKALLGAPQIQRVIQGQGIDTLMFVPSGALTTLPPALLITQPPQGGIQGDLIGPALKASKWLIREKTIAVLPSAASLRTLRFTQSTQTAGTAKTGDSLFMLADPDFAGKGLPSGVCGKQSNAVAGNEPIPDTGKLSALRQLEPLPCSKLEGEALLKTLGGTLLMGGDAREASLRVPSNAANLAKATVVSFATHGLVAGGEINVSEPGLVLAAPRSNETQDDGYLSATKVLNLKLSADLVILSGCNTAGPDKHDASGLSGLSKAFFAAGARSVLASNWSVDDEKTRTLMSETALARKKGETKGQALRRATLAILDGDHSDSHPRLWAPFVLFGDPR